MNEKAKIWHKDVLSTHQDMFYTAVLFTGIQILEN